MTENNTPVEVTEGAENPTPEPAPAIAEPTTPTIDARLAYLIGYYTPEGVDIEREMQFVQERTNQDGTIEYDYRPPPLAAQPTTTPTPAPTPAPAQAPANVRAEMNTPAPVFQGPENFPNMTPEGRIQWFREETERQQKEYDEQKESLVYL